VKIGVGLPTTIPGTAGALLVEWARHAEQLGFSSLATIDRIVYPCYEPLVALAAAAAATERIGLLTNILIAPVRDSVTLAKQAASIQELSGGRLVLGLAPGGRKDDFEAVDKRFERRGRQLDADVELMRAAWRGETLAGFEHPIVPRPVEIPLLFGGRHEKSIERVVRWGVGWTAGGTSAAQAAGMMANVREAWRKAGREGEPRFAELSYFALGPDADEGAREYLSHYYSFLPFGHAMWESIPRSGEALRTAVEDFAGAGFDELLLDPCIADVRQLELLAEAVLQ
jgi:alkanesulfonate monooxygenase SsuD/methylene tetrahydromethanopterin reductase-like flavin-dependent oxidoreductase (luciferase family)